LNTAGSPSCCCDALRSVSAAASNSSVVDRRPEVVRFVVTRMQGGGVQVGARAPSFTHGRAHAQRQYAAAERRLSATARVAFRARRSSPDGRWCRPRPVWAAPFWMLPTSLRHRFGLSRIGEKVQAGHVVIGAESCGLCSCGGSATWLPRSRCRGHVALVAVFQMIGSRARCSRRRRRVDRCWWISLPGSPHRIFGPPEGRRHPVWSRSGPRAAVRLVARFDDSCSRPPSPRAWSLNSPPIRPRAWRCRCHPL
jgi:hypothetical protein